MQVCHIRYTNRLATPYCDFFTEFISDGKLKTIISCLAQNVDLRISGLPYFVVQSQNLLVSMSISLAVVCQFLVLIQQDLYHVPFYPYSFH